MPSRSRRHSTSHNAVASVGRVGLGVLFGLLLLGALAAGPGHAQQYQDGQGRVTLALTGDALITRKLSVHSEPEFLRVRELIRSADVGFTNLEMLFHRYEEDVIPAAQSGGTHMAAHPSMAGELMWMGIDLVSRANNHTMDYGVGGLRATTRAIEDAGLVHAGAGENLGLARAPAYLDTPAGRVALISVSSSFAPHMRAGHQRRDVRGRPGLSPLRHETVRVVPHDDLGALRRLRDRLGLSGGDHGDTTTVLGTAFVAGEEQRVITRPHPGDLEEILATVREARRQANWVIVTSHTHQGAEHRELPAGFLVEFARRVIDEGADVVTAHGPHTLRGVEVYRGKPILYSLADFIYQNETVPLLPADSYENLKLPAESTPADWYDARADLPGRTWRRDVTFYDSALAIVEFMNGELHQVRLHPLVLGHEAPRPQRGRPMHATGEDARRVIATLQRLSGPFGTDIHFEDGIGVIRGADHRVAGSR